MKITVADKAGFCFGVRRAMKMAYDALEEAQGSPVYTLGPLVHNPQVIEQLEKDGIKSIEDLKAYPRGHLLIRTHGVSPHIRKEALALGYHIIDATCPLVKKIHEIVLKLLEENYSIVVIGHAHHPEVKGIVGEVDGKCTIIESVEDAQRFQEVTKLGIVVQTTALLPKFRKISMEMLNKAQEVRIFNTICHATVERQKSAEDLAKRTDLMIVIGGKNSSNTRRLLEICKRVNQNSHHIERPSEIEMGWFEDVNHIGITAGASTPDHIIKDVIESLKSISHTAPAS